VLVLPLREQVRVERVIAGVARRLDDAGDQPAEQPGADLLKANVIERAPLRELPRCPHRYAELNHARVLTRPQPPFMLAGGTHRELRALDAEGRAGL